MKRTSSIYLLNLLGIAIYLTQKCCEGLRWIKQEKIWMNIGRKDVKASWTGPFTNATSPDLTALPYTL